MIVQGVDRSWQVECMREHAFPFQCRAFNGVYDLHRGFIILARAVPMRRTRAAVARLTPGMGDWSAGVATRANSSILAMRLV